MKKGEPTWRQKLDMIVNVRRIRSELAQLYRSTPHRISSGDYLELEHHWHSIIDLHFRYDESNKPKGHSSNYRVTCVDLTPIGHRDVVGDGNR